MRGRRILVPSCLVLGAGIAAISWLNQHADPARPPALTQLPPETRSVPLDVSLDPSGQPYDTVLPRGARVVRRPLAVLRLPSGRVLFMGGEYVMFVKTGDSEPVQLADRGEGRYDVDAIWLDGKGSKLDTIVGVVLVEREGVVKRWKELRRVGYVTDGGVGGITTPEWAATPKGQDNEVSDLYESELVDKARQWFVADVDGHEGVDTLVFSNGYGDGYFPAVAGYDAAGRRLEITLWSVAAPWRLAFPQGTPPLQVTERERELAECLAGKRRVDGYRCRVAQ
jgi:hypothetical protein